MDGREAAIRGRVDANRPWCHLAYRHDVGKLRARKPMVVMHCLHLYERQHAIAATETEKANLKECPEEFKEYDFFTSLP